MEHSWQCQPSWSKNPLLEKKNHNISPRNPLLRAVNPLSRMGGGSDLNTESDDIIQTWDDLMMTESPVGPAIFSKLPPFNSSEVWSNSRGSLLSGQGHHPANLCQLYCWVVGDGRGPGSFSVRENGKNQAWCMQSNGVLDEGLMKQKCMTVCVCVWKAYFRTF